MIETATIHDCAALTAIAFEAKGHWHYPRYFLEIWHKEITISEDYVSSNIVRKKVIGAETVAFYSIVEMKKRRILRRGAS